jgi:SAM-dependent methyltransferase
MAGRSAASASVWRAHADRVNVNLCRAHWPASRPGRVLKTDLFDEASGQGLLPVLAADSGATFGIDQAGNTAALSRRRHASLRATVADVRALPFADGSFDLVISNSTLDHFERREEIEKSLREVARVLSDGGRLILTLDNPVNPVVAFRNLLPFPWLNRLGLVPYFVGQTAGPAEGRRLLTSAGFSTIAVGTVLHCPRAPAVALASLVDRTSWIWPRRMLLGLLGRFESLGRWPTRLATGYYVAFVAEKGGGDGAHVVYPERG